MTPTIRNRLLGAVAATALGLGAMTSANAATQLGFILDRSGSISGSEWGIITNGLSAAVASIPLGGLYEVSVVTFSSSANANIANFLVTDLTSRNSLATLIAALNGLGTGGSTNMAAAFNTMATTLNAAQNSGPSYVNIATDGAPNSETDATTARTNMTNGGVDNVSIEGIGVSASTAAFLQNNICFPGPCDTTIPFNFPAQGFYLGLASAADYATAVREKVEIITGVPEPMSLALFGMGLAGLGLIRRRMAA